MFQLVPCRHRLDEVLHSDPLQAPADGADGADGDATVERLAGAPAWSKLMEVGYGGMAVAKSIDINSITLR